MVAGCCGLIDKGRQVPLVVAPVDVHDRAGTCANAEVDAALFGRPPPPLYDPEIQHLAYVQKAPTPANNVGTVPARSHFNVLLYPLQCGGSYEASSGRCDHGCLGSRKRKEKSCQNEVQYM